jgi:hypothetical protein
VMVVSSACRNCSCGASISSPMASSSRKSNGVPSTGSMAP